MKIDSLFVQIPPERQDQAKAAAAILGDEVYTKLPFAAGHEADGGATPAQLILNRTWRPQLAITGDGRLSRRRKMAAMCFCLTRP